MNGVDIYDWLAQAFCIIAAVWFYRRREWVKFALISVAGLLNLWGMWYITYRFVPYVGKMG